MRLDVQTRSDAGEALKVWKTLAEEYAGKPPESMSGEDREKLEKAKTHFHDLDQKATKQEGEWEQADRAKQDAEELQDHLDRYRKPVTNLPHGYGRPTPTEQNAHEGATETFKKAHKEAFYSYLRHGDLHASVEQMRAAVPAEQHALVGNIGSLGGFTTTDDLQSEVNKALAAMAVIRPVARVIPTSASTVSFPSIQAADVNDADIYPTGYVGQWQKEGSITGGTAPTVQNYPKFGRNNITVFRWAPNAIEITEDLLDDSLAPLDSILGEIIAETLALDEDAGFINGDGVDAPRGLRNAGFTTVNSGDASTILYQGILDTLVALPSQYRDMNGGARWLMNDATYGVCLGVESSGGFPMFPPNSLPGTIFNKPILFSGFMPDVAGSAEPIIFGNFRYYGIADRQELRIKRLVERFGHNIGLLPTARVGGDILQDNAFREMTISA